jgi:hypothetical protein
MFNQYHYFFRELFYAATAALAVFSLMELARPGIVLAFLNLNWVLILWLAAGILMLLSLNK